MVLVDVCDESPELSPGKPISTSTPKTGIVVPTVSNHDDVVRNRVLSYLTSKKNVNRQDMVIEAIAAIGNDERGASAVAIMKWIMANHAIYDMNKLKTQIKGAILKCLDDGTISRSPNSKAAKGATGSFVLGKMAKGRSPTAPNRKSEKQRKPRKPKTV